MAAKRLKNNATKAMAIAIAGICLGTGIAVSMQNNVSADAATSKYTSDYGSKHEAILAGYELNVKVAEEGMVLLKNENATLPISTAKGLKAKRVTVFGYAGAVPNGGSGANGGDTSAGEVGDAGTVYSTLEAAGYKVNPYVQDFYNQEVGEGKNSDYKIKTDFEANKEKLAESYTSYGDAAVIVLGVGDTDDAYDAEKNPDGIKYNKQYNKAQYELIDHVTESGVFDKVIVFINKAYPVELDRIKNNDKVGAILLISEPGTNGLVAAGSILNGTVNPSGRLADTYPVDQTKDPSYVNYSGVNLGHYVDTSGKDIVSTIGYTDYEEGIYVGYRYWETRAKYEDEDWYNQNVSYTFGYGLSYTTFDWEVKPVKAAESEIKLNDVLKFDVKVTNTGDYAGKEVVQLYLNAPYKDGEIEKAENVLEDFAKTDLLQPGQSQTVTLTVKVKDLASYDWNDANKNGIYGYELDNGTYNLRIASNAHYGAGENDTQIAYEVNGTDGKTADNPSGTSIHVKYSETGYEIKNQFEDLNAYASGYSTTAMSSENKAYSTYDHPVNERGFDAPLSRASTHVSGDLKGLQVPATKPENVITSIEEMKKFAGQEIDDSETQPWYVPEDEMPEYMTEAERAEKPEADVVLSQLVGKAYNDPLWDDILDELTLLEMQNLINYGGWNTGAIPYIGKPSTRDTDGPKGWSGSGRGGETGNMICAEPMVAATFNTDLIYEVGKNMGDQGLWGSTDRTDGGSQESYTCWYAPGMNIHRGSFDGRLAEYYSEDPVLMGKMAAAISLGIRSKGGYITMKHFALHNDGGTVRSAFGTGSQGLDGLYAWVNEQALREVYLRGYQICANEGDANDAMASFTRFGHVNAGASYALNTEVFRNEWGCKGYIVTDIVLTPFQDGNQLIRAGGNLLLTAFGTTAKIFIVDEDTGEPLDAAKITATQVTAMRNAAKGILWSVANSNAMQVPTGASVVYRETETTLQTTVNQETTLDLGSAVVGTTRYAYSSVSYEVTEGILPVGMQLDGETGIVSGTPTVAGTYVVTLTASADGYIPATREFVIVVAPVADTAKADILAAIEDLNAAIDAIEVNPTVDLTSINTQLNSITSQLTAIKSAVDGIDIPEADLSSVNEKIAALETKIAALEAKSNEEKSGGCNSSVGMTAAGVALAVIALGTVAFAVVKRAKKDEE